MAGGLEEWLARAVRPMRSRLGAASHRVAVLIDGDSFSPRFCDQLFRYAASFGRVASAQLFANFAAANGGAWSADRSFERVLVVDDDGLVVSYPGLFERF